MTIYRNNFNDILRQGGPDALIQSLKDKTTPCPVASMPATDDGLTLALSGPVTFAHTARLARELRPRAAAARVLDWSAVTQVDSSAVALILELARAAGHGHTCASRRLACPA